MRHKLHNNLGRKGETISSALPVLAVLVLLLGYLISHDWLAAANFVLAFSTFLLVHETIKTRVQAETQRKELAFRAALVELVDNITNYRRWDSLKLLMKLDPDPYWWDHPLQFTRLNELLSSVDIAPQLFTWIIGECGNIQVLERQLRTEMRGEASKLSTEEKNRLMGVAHWIDLYLVRLACYVVCEAKRQGFHGIADGIEQARIFKPKPWNYGEPKTAAALDIVGKSWQAPMSELPEPDILGCEQCRLEELIEQANEEAKKLPSGIKGSPTGIEVAPGNFI